MSKSQGGLIGRLKRAVGQRVNARRLRSSLQITPREDLVSIGSTYGAWTIPAQALSKDSACYLAGLGEDASFDLGLIERFGCTVHAFDPVPEAARYAEGVAAEEPRFHFQPVGLWSSDGTLRFYENAEPGFVSRSATNMHGTGSYTEAPVRSVASLMSEFRDERVDLLKLSVEGSEYEILGEVLSKRLPVGVLCVEFAQPAPLQKIRAEIAALEAAGYELVNASLPPFNWKLTFCLPAGAATHGA
ncbi:MAG TPA: FkbM family methyltransferase [Solirubrobacteraceae bacterium]|jgi:FkbM family methyltransferase